jgi:hypothetical protein
MQEHHADEMGKLQRQLSALERRLMHETAELQTHVKDAEGVASAAAAELAAAACRCEG